MDRVELLKQMAKLLASNMELCDVDQRTAVSPDEDRLYSFQSGSRKLLIVTVLEGNIIKNSIVALDAELTDEDILNLNILLNSGLNGLTMEQINLDVITRMQGQAGERSHIVDVVLSEAGGDLFRRGRFTDLHRRYGRTFSNIRNWSDGAKASQLIDTGAERLLWREIPTEDDADSDKKMRSVSTSEVRHRCSR